MDEHDKPVHGDHDRISTLSTKPFHLQRLPTMLIAHIGMYFFAYRLALPSGSLRRMLASIFPDPPAIVARTLQHYAGAVRWGSRNNLHLLWKYGLDLRMREDVLLVQAASAGHVEVLRLLLDRGLDPNALQGSALEDPAWKNHVQCAELLLACGANSRANNTHALRIAAKCGHVDMVKLLLDHDVEQNGFPNWLGSPLILALEALFVVDTSETIRILIERGADVDSDALSAVRALIAEGKGDTLELIEKILSQKTPVSGLSDVGQGPSDIVCSA